ncbi:hypothetical protein T439DRAFT_323960 [Meredithblackwellia eburnea MCA 4105]
MIPRTAARTLLRTARPSSAMVIPSSSRVGFRFAHGYSNYKAQSQSGISFSVVAMAALIGWSGIIFSIAGRKSDKQHHHAAAEKPKAPSPVESEKSEPAPAEDSREAASQAAFNPETGEINWDCPCLGGMADGPCGEEFKAAFSCFVYSEDEPKGVDCVDKFRGMQECFRRYPEIYGSEAEDDDEEHLIAVAEHALSLPDEHFTDSPTASS